MNGKTLVNLANDWFHFYCKDGKTESQRKEEGVIRPIEKKTEYPSPHFFHYTTYPRQKKEPLFRFIISLLSVYSNSNFQRTQQVLTLKVM